ncbi:conserved hypothetical protein [Leptospira interrogans serovar Manilae]|uniref:Uncharacterized protein n=1 Tax=Leptospira interrogans serovar Manilae TaxID=214675 RepID=A0AAQ1SMP9_LEPIR|nr:hypothetical protein LEP1GSC013_2283 [Leptospira interrogans serovar Valbuzzi str. Duyster]ENO72087.1 hypothetical protein LEP1GSC012_2151 [Leptospira interrogans serovar Valbuzzi str. Valbuzzi]SOR60292.1 conserved hypothetical protein [Leptospira interrogans serovar Manilae]
MIYENSHIILQIDLSFVVVPTFKKSICRVQIPTFKIVSFYAELTLNRLLK